MIQVINENFTRPTIEWSTTKLIALASSFDSVLDVGCGNGRVVKQVKAKIRYGIDACLPAIQDAQKGNNGVDFRCGDLLEVTLPIVECIYGMDIIEHFEYKSAIRFLMECDRVALKCLMWFVPVGHHPQTEDDRGYGNHHYQTHRSEWQPEDMEALGYDVWFYPNWHKKIQPPKEKGAMWCLKRLE